jgi:hypothetical protein
MSNATKKQLATATTALLGVFAFQPTAAAEQKFQKLTGDIERRSSCELSLRLSLWCSVFAASPLQHERNRALASSVEINNKPVRKITPQRRVRLNTTYA